MSKNFLESLDNKRTKYDLTITAQFRKNVSTRILLD